MFTYIMGSLILKLKCTLLNALKSDYMLLYMVLDTLYSKIWLKYVTQLVKRHTNSFITTKWNIFSDP